MILSDSQIRERMNATKPEKRLVITPLLEQDQVGPAGIDLRLGNRFMVDMRTRDPFIDPQSESRPVDTFFDSTYREFGSKFMLYPGQLVLASTFEYVRLPKNLTGLLITRSSWNRLGVGVSSIVQPGYSGTLTIELCNRGTSPVAIYPGLRMVQICLFEMKAEAASDYMSQRMAKYVALSGPQVSAVAQDHEWSRILSWRSITAGDNN